MAFLTPIPAIPAGFRLRKQPSSQPFSHHRWLSPCLPDSPRFPSSFPFPPKRPLHRLPITNSKPNPTPTPPPRPSLRQRVSTFVYKFRRVSAEVQALASSSEHFILGSDLSTYHIASTSLIQDLHLPPTPHIRHQSPQHTLQTVHRHLYTANLPDSLRRQFLQTSSQLLPALHGWTHQFVDQARYLLSVQHQQLDPSAAAHALDALVHLLTLAAFEIRPPLHDSFQPPSVDVLPLGNSMSHALDPFFFAQSPIMQRVAPRSHSSSHPYLFVATRGVTVVRRSGLLWGPKIRAIERSYFTWIRSPFIMFFKPLKRLVGAWKAVLGGPSSGKEVVEQSELAEENRIGVKQGEETDDVRSLKVRRVVPSGKLDFGWKGLSALFLPTFTQEPAHELILFLYREIVPDKKLIRKQQRSALLQRVKRSITEPSHFRPWKKNGRRNTSANKALGVEETGLPRGKLKPVSLQLFAEVPWGTTHHLYPTSYVLPATKDLLRIDALTFSGLVSGVVTFLRNMDNTFVTLLVVASLVTYVVRVVAGWRRAVVEYNGRLAKERADLLVARQRSVLEYVAALGTEERFVDVCSVWLAEVLKDGVSPMELQRELFGEVTLTDEGAEKWKAWLTEMGFVR